MTNERKQDYTLRICQANRSQLIVILFEIFDTYMKDAQEQMEDGNYDEFKTSVSNAKLVIHHLLGALDPSYEISAQLTAIYRFFIRTLTQAVVRKDTKDFPRLIEMAASLRRAFEEAAKSDTSLPLMRNTQQVYAGLTYGKGVLKESFHEEDSRGFFA